MNFGDVFFGFHTMTVLPSGARKAVAGILLILIAIAIFREGAAQMPQKKADYKTLVNKLFDDGQTHRAAELWAEWWSNGGKTDPFYYIAAARFHVKNGNGEAANWNLRIASGMKVSQ